MEQNNLETNTNVVIAQSQIHLDDHHVQPWTQSAISVERLDIGSQDAMEEYPRDNNKPNKGAKKGRSRGPKKINDVGTNQDYHLDEVDIMSVSQYQPQQQE